MLITLLASLGGGIFRMLPEILNFFKSKEDMKHEQAMFTMQLEADKLKYQSNLAQTQEQNAGATSLAEITALIEATKAQAIVTGVKWVDAISSLMRPLLTLWWCIILYSSALIANFLVLLQAGMTLTTAMIAVWGPDEKAICASMISFWFVDRCLRKK